MEEKSSPNTDQISELNKIEGLTVCDQNIVEREILRHIEEACKEEVEEGELIENGNQIEQNHPKIFIDETEHETENERKIRLGEMTPFGSTLSSEPSSFNTSNKNSILEKYLQRQEELQKKFKNEKKTRVSTSQIRKEVHTLKKRRKKINLGTEIDESCSKQRSEPLFSEKIAINFEENSGSEYYPSEEEISSEDENLVTPVRGSQKRKRHRSVSKISGNDLSEESDFPSRSLLASIKCKVSKEIDDGDESEYQNRLRDYENSFDTTEILYYEFENSHFKIPLQTWSTLYNYQKVGLQWLWELHQQGVGGILGDEMGLGKTIQVISFLSGLYYSKLKNKCLPFRGLGPSLIMCPTTLMHQWVKEFHKWLPPVRIAVLHASGSYSGQRRKLIREVYKSRGVLVTSYVSMLQHSDELLRYDWHYVILDEGHKIRNPDAKITLAVKQLKTPHRIILSGSPLQNNLEELWSLFDFIYPGKLGALPLFQSQFSVPITHGGYANASETEVTIAYKCATVLKELISPYLLRRAKIDVKSHINLPEKNEQVLFCQLTDEQRSIYKSYIASGEISKILEGQTKIFVGLINLRKICNHPDLYTGGPKLLVGENENNLSEEERYGYWKKSGKMIVLETLLKIWHKQEHKVLLFSQGKRMLDILEIFLQTNNYSYLKMDGSTSISSRQPLIDNFNTNPSYFVMLLTTRVGGLGINLTGASRIIIFDPDWNPATDTQARERAWRIGQTQNVTIYRLITVGTIEEKIYHRQIFKQFLTNKVLKDPKQRRFFKSNDLFELFTLKESNEKGSTETGAIFAGTGSEINLNNLNFKKPKSKKKNYESDAAVKFSKTKIEQMKQIAQRLSQKLVQQSAKSIPNLEQNSSDDKSKPSTSKDNPSENVENIAELKPSETQNVEKTTSPTKAKLKKKHKSKKNYFEGEYVPYLVKTKSSKQKEEETNIKTEDDEYVLKKLFSKSGVCSALQHDTIMEGGPPDFALIEKEAEKVAQEAINELKKSQESCFSARTGIPNWTGKHGKMQTDTKIMSSNEILAKIKKRNGLIAVSKPESEVLNDLRNFLSSMGGTASTDLLIQKFQSQLPVSMTPLFKSLLNKICSFYRAPNDKGYWTLKTEF